MAQAEVIGEIQARIRDRGSAACIPVAGNTKFALAATAQAEGVERLPLSGLCGITAYEPSEFLITALAGTTIEDVNYALQEHGQYLPFDPLFVREGATLGGTISSGISGPCSMLYGGLRDFVMEVELIDGLGNRCRAGGKVVKNAAGFDFPKLVCGSYGRLGVLTEATVKVLPRPEKSVTLLTQLRDLPNCVQAIQRLRSQPLPINALDVLPGARLRLQVSGPSSCLDNVMARVRELSKSEWTTVTGVESEPNSIEGMILGQGVGSVIKRQPSDQTEFSSPNARLLVRVAMDLPHVSSLDQVAGELVGTSSLAYCCGGSVAWLLVEDAQYLQVLDDRLRELSRGGVVVRGPVDEMQLLGNLDWLRAAHRIQDAIDPHGRFARFRRPPTQALKFME